MKSTILNFYGIRIIVKSEDKFIDNVEHDYWYFLEDKKFKKTINFDIILKKPDYSAIPDKTASGYHQDYVIYKNKKIKYVDFHGACLCIFNEKKFSIISEDFTLAYEIFHLFLTSFIGDELDKKNLNRLHCFGISKDNKACLVMMPMGAGKTTLTMNFLMDEKSDFKVLSDDLALIDNKTRIHPFVLRLGIIEKDFIYDIPSKFVRKFERDGRVKKLVKMEHFKEKIATTSKPKILILGKRRNFSGCKIHKINKIKLFIPLIKSAVLGLELPQALALFLGSPIDNLKKLPIFLGRLNTLTKLLFKSKTYIMEAGYDREKNYMVMKRFLQKRL